MTVAEMMHRMSAVEYTEWRIIEGIEPFGERRADWRAAVCFSQLLQAQGTKVGAASLLGDLMDVFDETPSSVDEEAARTAKMESAALAWAKVFENAGT